MNSIRTPIRQHLSSSQFSATQNGQRCLPASSWYWRSVVADVSRKMLWFFGALLALSVVLLVVQASVMQSFYVPSSSMAPTLQVDDCIVVPKFTYGLRVPFVDGPILQWSSPERGRVVVFNREDDLTTVADESRRTFVKRVIGVAGDTVTLRADSVIVNGELLREPYVAPMRRLKDDTISFKVPEGELFVLGDNRDDSYDSRFWRWPFVPVKKVLGPVSAVYWSESHGARIISVTTHRTLRSSL